VRKCQARMRTRQWESQMDSYVRRKVRWESLKSGRWDPAVSWHRQDRAAPP
jgi:hypothetical protein